MVSLAEIRARNVQPVWQESVAVVQELVQSSIASGAPLPDLEHVALIPNGDVVATPGSPESADPVRQAATMLRALVDGVATPPELEEYIRKNLSSAAAPTLAEFARGLSFYERPGRRSDVERLLARAAAAEQMTRADEELRRLKEKAAESGGSRLDDTIFMDTVAMSGRRRQPVAAIAGVALLVVVAGGAWWWWRDRTKAPQASASAASTSTSGGGASAPLSPAATTADTSAGGAAPSTSSAAIPSTSSGAVSAPQSPMAKPGSSAVASAPATASTSPVAASAPATSGAGSAAPVATPVTGAAASAPVTPGGSVAPAAQGADASDPSALFERARAAVQSAVSKLVGPAPAEHASAPAPLSASEPVAPKTVHHKRPLPVPPPAATPVAVAVDVPAPPPSAAPEPQPPTDALPGAQDKTVYTSVDAAVIPPVLVRPVMPKAPPPDVPLDQIGSLEVLVDEQGDVEQVRLLSPANRYHDRMLVSAAKMWKFRPAFKDGHPVRYRTRIRITV
jgi:hypothetical protein